MYYVLDYDHPIDSNNGYYFFEDGLEFEGVDNWAAGRPFKQAPPSPIQVNILPLEGFQGEPAEMQDANMLLMSDRLVAALRRAGVANLDCYPAVLRDEENGRTFSYQAVNVIGLLSVADLKKSEWQNIDGAPLLDTHFDKLVVDERKASGMLLFRMLENSGTILVHERVRKALEEEGFSTLSFRPTT